MAQAARKSSAKKKAAAKVRCQTARSAESVQEYAELIGGRLMALARTQALLTNYGDTGVNVSEIVREEISAHAHAVDYEIDEPEVVISPKAEEVLVWPCMNSPPTP